MVAGNFKERLKKMMYSYMVWIRENYPDTKAAYGMCVTAAKAMVEAFPELRTERGWALCPHPWGQREHMWCVAPDGGIVDPTAIQFAPEGILGYKVYTEGDEVRLGPCANCGADIMGQPEDARPTVCGLECHKEFTAYLMDESYRLSRACDP